MRAKVASTANAAKQSCSRRVLGERADADVDRAEHERVRDRVRKHEGREEEIGRGDGQRRRGERRP
jgi:hypothetical protein